MKVFMTRALHPGDRMRVIDGTFAGSVGTIVDPDLCRDASCRLDPYGASNIVNNTQTPVPRWSRRRRVRHICNIPIVFTELSGTSAAPA